MCVKTSETFAFTHLKENLVKQAAHFNATQGIVSVSVAFVLIF